MFSSKDLFFTPTSGAYTVSKSLRFRLSASAYLTRTPGSAGNRTTWTWSGWVKRGLLSGSTAYGLFQGKLTSTDLTAITFSNDLINIQDFSIAGGYNLLWTSAAVFRDPSSWYHIVVAYDTTQASSANAVKLYVNGVQQTLTFSAGTGSYLQNRNSFVNATNAQEIGNYYISSYFDGYMADVNFINGYAYDPTYFGAYDTNGVWQPKQYTGSYDAASPNTGFYLKFTTVGATSGSNTGYGQDFSGNGNYWTTNNFGTTSTGTSAPSYDSMLDSPTNAAGDIGNYCVLNPISNIGNGTISNGNLSYTSGAAAWKCASGTIFVSSGKWYFEATLTSSSSSAMYGVINNNFPYSGYATYPGASPYGWALQSSTGGTGKWNNNSSTSVDAVSQAANDVYMVAFDVDAGKIWFGKNGTWYGSGDPANGTNAAYTNLTGQISPVISTNTASDIAALNCGQRPFAYTPPSGYSALNTQNLTTPTIANGAQYMAAVTYQGATAPNTVTTTSSNSGNNPNGVSFQPDLVWIKSRSAATDNKVTDALRGVTKAWITNSSNAPTTDTNGLTAFTASGFTVGSDTTYNNTTGPATYIAWQWLAGNVASPGNLNTNGSLNSYVSVNASAGFSIVSATAGASGISTVGHGLGVAPSFLIVKPVGATASSTQVFVSGVTSINQFLVLTDTRALATSANIWGSSLPDSNVFGFTNGNTVVASQAFIAYCFAPVAGYSAFGSYTANANADGPMVFLNFRPRYVLLKNTTRVADWIAYDSSRDLYNTETQQLYPNLSSAEASGANIDFLSNGFKIRAGSGSGINNTSGDVYIYAAFAENPFKISRAR